MTRVRSPAEAEDFSCTSSQFWGPPSLPQWVSGTSPGVMRPGCAANHLPPSCAKVKKREEPCGHHTRHLFFPYGRHYGRIFGSKYIYHGTILRTGTCTKNFYFHKRFNLFTEIKNSYTIIGMCATQTCN
jgi:hypothetical protein